MRGAAVEQEYMRASEAAEFCRLSVSTLASMRCYGGGPPFSKSGRRVVVYLVSDLREWMQSRRGGVDDAG
jgi:predicted DNA-binding transcriptional regulator AlpA